MVTQAVKPEVGEEERKHRKINYPDFTKVLNKNPLCTSCNTPVKKMIINGKPLLHPFLDTLLCEKCYSFYGDGEFSVDEDGSDKYCRWCGQGGTLFLCSDCTAGFCKKCIKRNLPRSVLKDVEEEDWQCFCCQVQPLFDLRSLAWAALCYAENTKRKKKGGTKSVVPSDSDEDYVDASEKSKRKSKKPKKEKLLSYEDRAYKLAVSKQNEFLNDIKNICDVVSRKVNEVKTKKFSKRSIESFNVENIEINHSKILSIFETFKSTSEDLEEKITKFLPEWKKALEIAKEDDKKPEEDLVENGEGKSKKSVVNSSDDESPGNSKAKNKSVNNDSDEESQGDSKSRRRSKKSIDKSVNNDADSETKNKKRPEQTSKKSGSDESEDDSKNNKTRKSKRSSESEDKLKKSVVNDSEEESAGNSKAKKKSANKDSDEESQGDSKSRRRPKKSIDKRASKKSASDESEDDSKSNKTRKSNRSSESKKHKSKQESDGSESEDEVKSKSKSEESKSKSKKDSDDKLKEDSKKEDSDKESTKMEVEEDEMKKIKSKSDKQKKSNDGSESESDAEKADSKESKRNKRQRSVSKEKTDEISAKHFKTDDMTSDKDKEVSD